MSLMSEVGQKAFNLGVPLAVHMDVTYRCNERCVHCYLDHDDHGEMTFAEIKDLLDQLAAADVFFLTTRSHGAQSAPWGPRFERRRDLSPPRPLRDHFPLSLNGALN